MRYVLGLVLVSSACFCCFGCSTQPGLRADPSKLDSGFWSFYSADPNARMADVWTVQDGVLVCSGSPLGYIYSNETYDNFTLTLQWRCPDAKGPGKASVLMRMSGDHRIWPKSLEAQLNAPDAGDFWGLDGYDLAGPAERTGALDHEQFGKLTNLKKTQTLEKPAGQWNTYEILAEGDTVTLIINGIEVNRATGCAPTKGPICLTSEGSEIHFRDITLRPLVQE